MTVGGSPGPVVQRRRLRAELRRVRLEAGLTQDQVAEAMDWSLSKLIRIENGSVSISTNDLKAILQYYKITDSDRVADLIAMGRVARERSWWSEYRDIASRQTLQLIEYEAAAMISRNFQLSVVPGLLQTEEYARAVLEENNAQRSGDEVDVLVSIRMHRQELIDRAEPPLLFFIMDEGVVRRQVGGPAVMHRQLQRLIDVSAKPNVTVEVVPFSAGFHPGTLGSFVIHEFPDDADDDTVYLENQQGEFLNRDDPDEILAYRERFERLRQLSLGPEGTESFLVKLVDEMA
jgi:transcriptional regulator with XRE-family HTH domain